MKPRSKVGSPTALSLPISMMASLMIVLFECKVVTRPLKVASPSTTKLFCIYVLPKTVNVFEALVFTNNLEPTDKVSVGVLFDIPTIPEVTKLVVAAGVLYMESYSRFLSHRQD